MKNPIDPILLEKYLNQTCTEQERKWVEAWYASLEGTNNYLGSLSEHDYLALKQDTFDQIQENLEKPRVKSIRLNVLRWVGGIAAALVLIAGFYQYKNVFTPSVAITKRIESALPQKIHFENKAPRIVTHLLPDGTTVWLHSGAIISYPKSFKDKQREVTFSGEGFFDVAHDPEHPFVVRSGDLNIKVLGTKFNVKAASNQRIFEVAVVAGSVAVSASASTTEAPPVILKPKEQVFFETDSKRLTASNIPTKDKQEIYEPITINFDGTELKEVIQLLDKRFNTQIHLVNPSMSSCRLTADFEEQPLPVILDMLCTSLEATYSLSGNVVLITGEPCQ